VAELEPRCIPIHRSLVRPVQYMGCERNSFGALMIACAFVVVSYGVSVEIVAVTATGFLLGVRKLRKLTREDALFPQVRFRHYRFADEYEPVADIDAVSPEAPTSVPLPEPS
jgi:type IV secretory pathway TrbD component